jgi:hydrocephalus-inducing protein
VLFSASFQCVGFQRDNRSRCSLFSYFPIYIFFLFKALAIDITDRIPSDHPQGIPYKLIGEAGIPGISVISPEYIGSIFEEHRVVQSLSRFQFHSAELDSGSGVYGEQENKFMFFNSIVGRKSYARFKITNPNKVSHLKLVVLSCYKWKNAFSVLAPKTNVLDKKHFSVSLFSPTCLFIC